PVLGAIDQVLVAGTAERALVRVPLHAALLEGVGEAQANRKVDHVLPGCRVVARVPVRRQGSCAVVLVVGLEFVAQSGAEVGCPIVHGEVRQGSIGGVRIGLYAAVVGSSVGQNKAAVVGSEAGRVRYGCVPHAVCHEDVVAGTASVGVFGGV